MRNLSIDHIFAKPSQKLGLLRITVFGIWSFIIASTPFENLALLPVELYQAVGIYKWILLSDSYLISNLVLSHSFLKTLKYTLLIGCLLCTFGFRPFKKIALPTVLLLFLGDAIVKGFNGFVNHAEMGVLFSAFFLAFSPAADSYSFSLQETRKTNREEQNYILPIVLVSIVFCFSYSFIGIHRFVYGGMEIFSGDALPHFLSVNTFKHSKFGFEWGIYVLKHEIILDMFKTGFAVITLFEVFTPVVLFSRRFRIVWLFIMIPFHLLSLLTMNIFFWENILLILVLLLYPIKRTNLELQVH